jgi:LysM repeat protein
MNLKKNGLKMAAILTLAAIVLSACDYTVSTAPAATPTLLTPSGQFIQTTPLSGETTFNDLATAGALQSSQTQTAMALGGTPATPQPVVVTGTGVTPQTGITPTNIVPGATTAVAATVAVVATTPSGPVPTSGPKPASYTLQAGEFPYCIARRFNVNPDELLSLNGISDGGLYMPGLVLKIPQTGNTFPASRALQTHPATYTVVSGDETLYSVACKYGDVDPAAIASMNGIAVSTKLTVGQKLNIP